MLNQVSPGKMQIKNNNLAQNVPEFGSVHTVFAELQPSTLPVCNQITDENQKNHYFMLKTVSFFKYLVFNLD